METSSKIIEKLKNQPFGVEIEMNNIQRETAAKIAANFFETNYKYTAGQHSAWSTWSKNGREWKFENDITIEGPDEEKCELVTPILNYEDIEILQKLVTKLKSAGAKSDYKRNCDVHIHIDATDHTAETLTNLVNIMANYEQTIINSLNLNLNRINTYCKKVDRNLLQALNIKQPNNLEDFADIWYISQKANYVRDQHFNYTRCHMLNLHATFTMKTVEFRFFQFNPESNNLGGIDIDELKGYIQFCLALNQISKEKDYTKFLITATRNTKDNVDQIIKKMNITDDEFKPVKDLFTKRQNTKKN